MVAHVVLLTRVGRRGLVNIVLIKLVGICVSACSINIFINIVTAFTSTRHTVVRGVR